MQWSSQISNITKKVNFKLGKIKSVASFLTSHTKKLLVNALVMPYFHYCSPAWSSAAPFRLRKVDKKVVDASNFLGRKDNYSIYNVIDLSRNYVTTFSSFFRISLVQNGVKVLILHEKIDKYRKYQINSTLGEVVTDS